MAGTEAQGAAAVLSIQAMQAEHLDEVYALETRLFDAPHTRRQLALMSGPGYSNRVALMNDQLAGYVFCRAIADQADLLIIAVAEHYQRQGLAQALLDDLSAALRARQVTQLFLEVRAGNLPAIAFYERNGFDYAYRREAYYPKADGGREDACIYSLDL